MLLANFSFCIKWGTVLEAACIKGYTEIDKGADVNKWNSHTSEICNISLIKVFSSQWGNSLLKAAIESGNTETAKWLIDKGADVNKCDRVTAIY